MKHLDDVTIKTQDDAPTSTDKYGQGTETTPTVYDGKGLEIPMSFETNLRMSGDAKVKQHSRVYFETLDVGTLAMDQDVTVVKPSGRTLTGSIFQIDTNAGMVVARWQ